MKKYNLSEIMKKAWSIKKSNKEVTFSECLKKAWAMAKALVNKIKFVNNMDIEADGYTRELTRWTKGGHDRIYINGGSRRGDGYIDLIKGVACLRGNLTYQKKMAEMILAMDFNGSVK